MSHPTLDKDNQIHNFPFGMLWNVNKKLFKNAIKVEYWNTADLEASENKYQVNIYGIEDKYHMQT